MLCLAVSCQRTYKAKTENLSGKITYFKDKSSGLCFGAINSGSADGYEITSLTCVPCDSVKHLIKE